MGGLSQQQFSIIQSQSNQALIENTLGGGRESPKAVNVYKPTFIINNSFQNEMSQDEVATRDASKKYSRSSKQPTANQGQIPSSNSSMMMQQQSNLQSNPLHSSGKSTYQSSSQNSQSMQNQSRLKKNSGIDRSSSMTGVTSTKLGSSKTSKQDANLYSASSKHISQAPRELGPSQYLNDKQASSLSKMQYQSASYMGSSQQHHSSQMQTTNSVDQHRGVGPDS